MSLEDQHAYDAGRARPGLALPGVLLGVGLGGFVDGIGLHQILQWHHLLSSAGTARLDLPPVPTDTVAGLQTNTFADGLFHAFTWVMVVIGLAVLHSRFRRNAARAGRSRVLWGWMLVGWGGFNLVEGLVDHHLLAIHHVRAGPYQLSWDIAFLIFGVLLMLGGHALQRSGSRPPATG